VHGLIFKSNKKYECLGCLYLLNAEYKGKDEQGEDNITFHCMIQKCVKEREGKKD